MLTASNVRFLALFSATRAEGQSARLWVTTGNWSGYAIGEEERPFEDYRLLLQTIYLCSYG